MPRSHPPTLITLVRAAMRENDLVPRGATVLVAVSGGPDSMALLHVLAGLRHRMAYGLFAHGVDHGLRREGTVELDVAEAFAHSLDVPFGRTRVHVAAGGNLQARARAARWQALCGAAAGQGASRIATGHHADDRAETFVMRLMRGTGPRGLALLPLRAGERIRPMIRARRVDVLAHVARHHIPHCADPSNGDPRFLRTRVRQEVLPILEKISPRIVEHICALADAAGSPRFGGNDEVAPTHLPPGADPLHPLHSPKRMLHREDG